MAGPPQPQHREAVLAAPASLIDLLRDSAARHAGRPLFLTRAGGATGTDATWRSVTYADFASAVEQLRAGLAALQVGPGDRVGIIAGNRPEWAVAAYATYGRGAAFVPMYETQSERDWLFIARDAGLKVLFVSTAEIAARLRAARGELTGLEHVVPLDSADGLVSYGALLEQGRRTPVAPLPVGPADVAAIIYTSGTTGEPKGVVLSHGNVVSNVMAMLATTPISPDHRTLSLLPWAHAFGHTVELHGVVAAGASTALATSLETVTRDFAEVRPTALVAVPRVFLRVHGAVHAMMADRPAPVRWLFRRGLEASVRRAAGQRLGPSAALLRAAADRLIFARVRARVGGRLGFAISGAAALPREAAELIDGLGISVYEGYGLTEASPVVSANVPGHRRMGSAGRPLPGVRVVIDRAAAPPDGEARDEGEIVVYGPNVMQGYHGREEETRAVLTPDGGLRTGDLGRVDDDGYLWVTGRIKEQYKLANGRYVAPGPLEERLKLSPLIAAAMITGENRPHNVALIVPAGGPASSMDRAVLRDAIRAELDRLGRGWRPYERIKAFALIDEDFTQANDMLTPSLKLKRRNIVRRWAAELEALHAAAEADA